MGQNYERNMRKRRSVQSQSVCESDSLPLPSFIWFSGLSLTLEDLKSLHGQSSIADLTQSFSTIKYLPWRIGARFHWSDLWLFTILHYGVVWNLRGSGCKVRCWKVHEEVTGEIYLINLHMRWNGNQIFNSLTPFSLSCSALSPLLHSIVWAWMRAFIFHDVRHKISRCL